MPRLVSRGTAAALEYEPPVCALNDAARRALRDLADNRGTRFYEAQLKDVVRQLGLGVGDANERLAAQLQRLDALRARRREKGTDKTDEEARLEAHLLHLEGDVDAVTRDAERAVRDVIDKRSELEDEAAVLADLHAAAVARHVDAAPPPRQPRADDDDDDEEGDAAHPQDQKQDPVPSTLDAFRERRAQKLAEYSDRLTPAQRYARHNDYAGFKKLWHDAVAGEDGPALPDASKWFRSDGQPVMDRPGAAPRHAPDSSGDDDDDDIAVAREVLSLNCPLTLRPMEEPYSNSKCKHTFEKAAILSYLARQGSVQCPQTGCSETFSRASFAQDFYLDQAIQRRIQRANQAQGHEDMDDDDDDEDGGDGGDVMVRGHRAVRGRVPKAERLSGV